MSIKLYGPGKRGRNRYITAVVRAKGQRVEISTNTLDSRNARRFARDVEAELFERHKFGGRPRTLAEAIDRYIAFRRPSLADERRLIKIRRFIGKRHLRNIGQADFEECATSLLPGLSNATWNRDIYTPLQAVLRHHGIVLALRRPKQSQPSYRALTADQRDILIKNAGDVDLRVLLIVLFYCGARISEAIGLERDRVDFTDRTICFETTKTGDKHWRPLHRKAAAAIKRLPVREDGRVFRWRTRWGPQKALDLLCKRTGIYFTPHMARHTFADLMLERGASVRDLMDAGRWDSEKSAMRYTARRVERVRRAVERL